MSIDGISNSVSMMRMPPPPPDPAKMVSDIIGAKDTDGDGMLTIEESGISQEIFGQIDADGDGFISQDELLSKIQEKMEEMKEKMGNPPPEEEETSDIDTIKKMMAEMQQTTEDDSDTDSKTGVDMYTKLLEQLGMSGDEIKSFFDILTKNPTTSDA